MGFIKNAWYCAGFTDELKQGDKVARTFLGESVVLFRQASGNVAAIEDRCPHRFAPLSSGRQVGDTLECAYHGLRFSATGECVENPHGDGAIPKAAHIRAYPTFERHGFIWIWMGQPEQADQRTLPDFSMIDERAGWSRVQGYLHVAANYQLLIDNLMDLSHVQYLHVLLSSRDTESSPHYKLRKDVEQQGDTVVSIHEHEYGSMNPLLNMLWERGQPPKFGHIRANMRWDVPSMLLLDTGAHAVDEQLSDGLSIPSAHLLTPENETSTHYFWCLTRNRYVGNPTVSEQVRQGIDMTFRTEDEPMIEACQRKMGHADLMDLKPVLLASDAAAVRVRRVLQRRLAAENEAAARQ